MALSDHDLQQLVSRANAGDNDALSLLVSEMIPIVRLQASSFGKVSGIEDNEDIFQEGMIGFLSAVRSYQKDSPASFKTYASVCTKNRMISAARKATGGRSVRPQNAVPLEECEPTSDTLSLEEQLIIREKCKDLLSYIHENLSAKEQSVLQLFLSGLSYDEIAQKLGSSSKSIDNALQRVRQKLKKYH